MEGSTIHFFPGMFAELKKKHALLIPKPENRTFGLHDHESKLQVVHNFRNCNLKFIYFLHERPFYLTSGD